MLLLSENKWQAPPMIPVAAAECQRIEEVPVFSLLPQVTAAGAVDFFCCRS